jgi:hypothetical protein
MRRDKRCLSRRVRQSQVDEQERVVGGEDAEHPSRVEVAEVDTPPRVHQDAGDEEPREHEEEIDAAPTEARDPCIQSVDDARRRREQQTVIDEDERDRRAAQTIECREAADSVRDLFLLLGSDRLVPRTGRL